MLRQVQERPRALHPLVETAFDRIAGTPAPLAALGITTPMFDLALQLRFSDSLPRKKATLDLRCTGGRVTLPVTSTRYGEVSTVVLTNVTVARADVLTPGYDTQRVAAAANPAAVDVIQRFGAKVLTDVEMSLQSTPMFRFSAGAQNLFDTYPYENIACTVASVAAGTNGADNAGTQPYNANSPYGFNGRPCSSAPG